MKILISNDDGYDAPGIIALSNSLNDIAEIFVIAPAENMSGAGSSLTANRPIKILEKDNGFYAISGTPVDCVFLGLRELCPFKPDMVVSGINKGANMAEDLRYSGTVGAAFEGEDLNLPSIAVSAAILKGGEGPEQEPNYESAAFIARELVLKIRDLKIDSKLTLNVNVPNIPYDEIKGISTTTIGTWGPRNPPKKTENAQEYLVTHRDRRPPNDLDTDIATVYRGEVSVSIIKPNFLHREEIEQEQKIFNTEVSKWLEK